MVIPIFTDIKIAPSSVKLDEIIQSLNDDITKTEDEGKIKNISLIKQ